MRRQIFGIFMAATLLSGCRGSTIGDKGATRLLAESSNKSGRVDACGRAYPEQAPSEVLTATAEACLSCRDVGWLLRNRVKELAQDRKVIAVATLKRDTASVCAYVEQERVSVPVFITEDLNDFLGDEKSIALVRSEAAGVIVFRGLNGLAIQRLLLQHSRAPDAESDVPVGLITNK